MRPTALRRRPSAVLGGSILLFFLLIIIFGDFLRPHDPVQTDIWNTLALPSAEYPLGTDDLGRCLLSRLIAGTKTTLVSALLVEGAILMLGSLIGMTAGYIGGLTDALIVMIIDILLAFPSIILALVIAGLLGAGLPNVLFAMILVYWVEPARIARNMTLALREKDFITASRGLGSAAFTVIRRHIIPHLLPNMLVYGALNMSSIIIGISSLSFIGLGVKPPGAEWGALLTEARSYMGVNPHALILIMLCIMLSIAGFQLLGEAARDALNPRLSHLGLNEKSMRKKVFLG